jgi:hypothetical protein
MSDDYLYLPHDYLKNIIPSLLFLFSKLLIRLLLKKLNNYKKYAEIPNFPGS